MLSNLFESNRQWAEDIVERDPDFFRKQSRGQTPLYLWIGCSDSRVPAAQVLGLMPGEVFVHRNIANIVTPSDLSMRAAVDFALNVLRVQHVILCGHYRCSGVGAVLHGGVHGPVEEWLAPIEDVRHLHAVDLNVVSEDDRLDLLCEMNVAYQVLNVAMLPPVRAVWNEGRKVCVHGWMYDVGSGRLSDMGLTVCASDDADAAVEAMLARRINLRKEGAGGSVSTGPS